MIRSVLAVPAGRGITALAILAGCFLPGGCATGDGEGREVRLIPARPYEADIPIPLGFAMVDQASEDRSTGTARLYLRHVYEGSADKHAIRNFYREQMPLARWSKVSDGNIKGDFVMRFEKEPESCTVHITSAQGWNSKGARIEIVVAREERGTPPPPSGRSS